MSAFVGKEPVPISRPDDPENIVWIYPKLNLGRQQQVQTALLQHMQAGQDAKDTRLDLGAANLTLLEVFIHHWEGPLFEGRPFSRANLEELDPDLPLLDAVLAEIARRNPGAASDPNVPAPASTNGGGPSSRASLRSVTR